MSQLSTLSKTFTDQLNRPISLLHPPQRIVSLVPSQTEFLFDLGLENQIVGITKFCVHPAEKTKGKTIVGGTKNFHFDVIRALQPDLIIGNKEENYQEGIQALEKDFTVWMSDVLTLQDAYEMMFAIGALTGKTNEAGQLVNASKKAFGQLKQKPPRRVLYLIWKKPWMAAGVDTFIHSMLATAGLRNALSASRYPELTVQQIKDINPEMVLLSSEPYPFKEKHLHEVKALLPNSEVLLVDGEMFSWFGSRMLMAADYFNQLF